MKENKKLFALDIGTRSVVGIVLEEQEPEKYAVIDILSLEHTERSMLDGQIHDILAVSNIITLIKTEMENKHGPLKKVSVAAAGRALKTERAAFTVEISGKPIIKKQDILHLELSAVQQAQASVALKHMHGSSQQYYCVGYSVLYYRLDGEEIGSLIDQRGETASVEIIATFLPRVVIESLIAALSRSELEMDALTLEPIAAINVLIPSSMRRLNVALVDIGAGTSDIAITNSGTVTAYGMVPVAGDEITEAISDEYLLDFPAAEQVKRQLSSNSTVTITDILGFETKVSSEEVIDKISPSINRLAHAICEEILRLNNNKAPQAVMLIGGGSLTPVIPKKIANQLSLPDNRVAIRGIDAITSVSVDKQITKGPELVTPIGIAIAAKISPIQYHTVYVNDQPVRLFEMKQLTVGDCLLTGGIQLNELYGRPGLAMIISLNGQNITIPGELGEGPSITKNGNSASFDTPVASGDQLIVQKGEDGREPQVQIQDLLDGFPHRTVTINGVSVTVKARITCNGLPAEPGQFIHDRDKIECLLPETIEELFIESGLQQELKKLRPFRILLNGKDTFFPLFSSKMFRNGWEVKMTSGYEHLDEITIEDKKPITVRELAETKQVILTQSIPVLFNGKEITLSKKITEFYREEESLLENDLIYEGDIIHYKQKKLEPFLFQDLFGQVQINMPTQASGRFTLLKNNQKTTFMGKIEPGDDLKIVWPVK
nr:cell division protein FtsA [uncultured Bacillus sp.]